MPVDVNKELCDRLVEVIKEYERAYGIEFVSGKFYGYYSIVTKENQICGMTQIKEKA
jgi:hypothetical protein